MLKAFKYRLYPNATQTIFLKKTMGCVRYYWNQQVSVFNSYDKESAYTPKFKTSTETWNEHEWMKDVSAAAIQQKENDFIEFRRQYFSKSRKTKIKRPRFKKRGQGESFRLPFPRFTLKGDRIKIEKIGLIKFSKDRTIPDDTKLMSVTVSMDQCGSFFASVLVKTNSLHVQKTGKTIGIDVGLSEFAVTSDGEVVPNPRYFRKSQAKLRKGQKHFSRKKKGSSRRKKAKLKVATLYRKIANQRKFFLHNVSIGIVKRYDEIFIEDLNISGMVKNRKLAKSISDASFFKFFSLLRYKCDWYGKTLTKTYRFAPTSKTCSSCGKVKEQLELSERTYHCEACGLIMNRDENAAKNIQAMGVDIAKRAQRECKTLAC